MKVFERVLAALSAQDMTPAELADACGTTFRTLYNGTLMRLRDGGEIHVVAWIRGQDRGGNPRPVYRIGPGENVPRPAPLAATVKAKAWRTKYPDRNQKAKRKWERKNRDRVNKMGRISRAKREGQSVVAVIDPLLATLIGRPINTMEEEAA